MSYRFASALLFALGVCSLPAFGQLFSVGVKAGVPINDAFVTTGQFEPGTSPGTTTNRYIIGPEVELRLPFHLGVEADALYRHSVLDGSGSSQWEFPILLKYRFKGIPLLHPFVDAGPTFNHVSDIALFTRHSSAAGIAVGAGVDFHALILHITPEFRYTRWGSENYYLPTSTASLASSQNQAEFLVGFTF